ncbi:uncharacterized protein LOC113305662 [Papaver somniferum]|uniref:uncharacterized protein LOC113305662 n=1 Tax=Papaver somniferum TaxID=3469 RepID=UPI000E702CEE|nr:uncharacterized protein LOC113305662 [Papaver somniferum]
MDLSVVDLNTSYEESPSIDLTSDTEYRCLAWRPENHRTSSENVWVHLPGLSLEYWEEKTLLTIGRALEEPIKIDDATLNYETGYYARMLINIDFSKKVPNKLWIKTKHGGFMQSVLLINPPKFCQHCKFVGHLLMECHFKTTQSNEEGVNKSGEQAKIQTPVQEDNLIEHSVVKYVNGKDGSISTASVPVTSWSRVVQKPSTSKPSPSSNVDSEVITKVSVAITSSNVQIPNKYNFRKNPGKGGSERPSTKTMKVLFWNLRGLRRESQMITIIIGGVLISGVHAHVGINQRKFLWSEMEMISDLKMPWLVIGDFNVITSIEEKVGGRSPNKKTMMDFLNCLNNCELIQAPKFGIQHSWSNYQHGNKRILCNLDRAIFNQLWLQKYEDWIYKVGLRIASDHSPLLGGNVSIPKPKNTPMKFQKMWISHPEFLEVVQQCWSAPIDSDTAFIFQNKLKRLKKALNDWNWKVFGNIHTHIKEAEVKVQEAMLNSDRNPFDEPTLSKLIEAQNIYNTKEVQQARNLISLLEDGDGEIITDQDKIVEKLVKHFEQKFKFQQVVIDQSLLNTIPAVITSMDQNMLDAIPYEEEIKKTVFSMDPYSSPGPDGFSGCFYKTFWSIVQKDVIQAVQLCWRRRFIPKGLNSNFLVLIPKIEGAKIPSNFRPIGLSNVIFKIFTKILAIRISTLLHKLISPQQAAYVKGRSNQEQMLLASEMVNEMKKKRSGNVGLKLDISQD